VDGVEVVDVVDISDDDAPSIIEVDASISELADAIDAVAVAADDVDDVEITPSDDLRVLVPNLAAIMGGAMADAETPMRSCNTSLCDDIVVITHSTAIANNIEDIVERRRLLEEALQQYDKY